MDMYLPHLEASAPPYINLDPPALVEPEVGWTELGKQLAPVQLAVAGLYRKLVNHKEGQSE